MRKLNSEMFDQPLRCWRRGAVGVAGRCTTIRGRILIAFLVMSMITAGLGYYATLGVKDAGILVDRTYDQSLMSINYARAAAGDFAAMRATFARRWIENDPAYRAKLDQEIKTLAKTLSDDLGVAVRRSQSDRAKAAAANALRAANEWMGVSEHLLDQTKLDANWQTLDAYVSKVDEQIDLLINYTAGDGFLYRQSARAAVVRDINLNVGGTLLALLLSGMVAWALTDRIIKPVAAASSVAEHIARGRLDVEIPNGSTDELGNLLTSMKVMRDNIKTIMDREVAQRRSAQARLADALESSQEGVLVVDADDRIALANGQAANFLGVAPELLRAGTPLTELWPALQNSVETGRILRWQCNGEPEEVLLTDGRWLRVSQSATRDGGFIVVCSDISQSKEQKARLHQINLRLDAALDNMSQGLCLFDVQNRLEVVNRRFYEIFGLSPDLIEPGTEFQKILALSQARNQNVCETPAQLLAAQADSVTRHEAGTHYYELNDGRFIASVCSPTSNGGWVATFEDVTERRQAEAKIMHMARHDALTNLPNRVLFGEKMEHALAQGEKLAVLFLDLDRFKTVNDSLGHPIGDALLCAVTHRLQQAVHATDTVARLGGDEFAIVQVGAGPSHASELAGRIIDAISEPFDVSGHQVVIGVSVGIAVAPADGEQPDQLLRNADMALYRAKSEGRGTYHFFQPEMNAQMQARHALEHDLRKALFGGEFEMYYQPIVDLNSGKVTSFEALIRWNHPTRGVVGPNDFVPVAEEIGLIIPLGDWVLRQACRDAASWPGKLSVAVNLSAAQFRNPTLAFSVVSALGGSGLAASRLGLEITETVLLQDDRSVVETLHQIRELGVRISMDDFGTGYSSLSYLRSFPFDKIKIDRTFIHELGKKNDCIAITRAVAGLGSNLGMDTIAEGVESQEQLEIVRAEGCTHAQGYLFSPPRPVSEVPQLLQGIWPCINAA